MVQIGGKTKKAHKATQPQFVVQKAYGVNEYLKFVADNSGLSFVWTSDPNDATQFASKYAAKERVRDIEGLPATRCFKEL